MNPIRVVVIEDHDLTRLGLCTGLKQYNEIDVVGEATKGDVGLALLQSLHPDVAIVDIGLPDISGVELTQRFKHLQQEDKSLVTKILIMTMQDTEEAVLAAFGAGADSYCLKDVSLEGLVTALQTTAQGNSWIDPAIAQFILEKTRNTYTTTTHKKTKVEIYGLSPEDAGEMVSKLTEREFEVLQSLVEGSSNEQISEKLYISVGTVKTHVRSILNKLCVEDRTQAAVRALRTGLIS